MLTFKRAAFKTERAVDLHLLDLRDFILAGGLGGGSRGRDARWRCARYGSFVGERDGFIRILKWHTSSGLSISHQA